MLALDTSCSPVTCSLVLAVYHLSAALPHLRYCSSCRQLAPPNNSRLHLARLPLDVRCRLIRIPTLPLFSRRLRLASSYSISIIMRTLFFSTHMLMMSPPPPLLPLPLPSHPRFSIVVASALVAITVITVTRVAVRGGLRGALADGMRGVVDAAN